MFRLDNKSVVITGGGSGIGKAIALLFARQGASVYIMDIDQQAGEETTNQIKNDNGKAFFSICNVTEHALVAEIFSKIPKIDILINNAGISHIGNLEATTESDFDRIVNVNLKGIYNCLHAAIPVMKAQGGVIINMSSIAAHVGIQDRFAYSMSKGAVHAITLSIARDYLAHNIRCNSISPARVHTPFVDNFLAKNYAGKEKEMFDKLAKSQPIGRMGKPEEIATLALFLCSEEASFISGSDYPIDGGFIHLNN